MKTARFSSASALLNCSMEVTARIVPKDRPIAPRFGNNGRGIGKPEEKEATSLTKADRSGMLGIKAAIIKRTFVDVRE